MLKTVERVSSDKICDIYSNEQADSGKKISSTFSFCLSIILETESGSCRLLLVSSVWVVKGSSRKRRVYFVSFHISGNHGSQELPKEKAL